MYGVSHRLAGTCLLYLWEKRERSLAIFLKHVTVVITSTIRHDRALLYTCCSAGNWGARTHRPGLVIHQEQQNGAHGQSKTGQRRLEGTWASSPIQTGPPTTLCSVPLCPNLPFTLPKARLHSVTTFARVCLRARKCAGSTFIAVNPVNSDCW